MNAAKVRNVSRMSDLQLLRALRAGDAVRAGGLVINWNGEAFAVAAGGPSFTLDADAADEIRRVLSLSRAVAITMSRWQKVSSDVYASGPWRIQRLSRGWRWYHVVRFGPTRDLCGKVVTLAEAKHECETANSVLQKEGL